MSGSQASGSLACGLQTHAPGTQKRGPDAHEHTPAAQKRARKTGAPSIKTQQSRNTLRETLELLLDMPSEIHPGQTNIIAAALGLLKEAAKGNASAFIALRDTLGEKPTDKLDHTSSDRSMSPVPVIDLSGFSFAEVTALAKTVFGKE